PGVSGGEWNRRTGPVEVVFVPSNQISASAGTLMVRGAGLSAGATGAGGDSSRAPAGATPAEAAGQLGAAGRGGPRQRRAGGGGWGGGATGASVVPVGGVAAAGCDADDA